MLLRTLWSNLKESQGYFDCFFKFQMQIIHLNHSKNVLISNKGDIDIWVSLVNFAKTKVRLLMKKFQALEFDHEAFKQWQKLLQIFFYCDFFYSVLLSCNVMNCMKNAWTLKDNHNYFGWFQIFILWWSTICNWFTSLWPHSSRNNQGDKFRLELL